MKLAIGYPWSSPFVYTEFVDSTLKMEHPDGCEVKYFRGAGWCSARRHIDLCEQAMEWGAELICIIGADQSYPPTMLKQLINRYNEGYDCVAAMVPVRGYVAWQDMKPFQPMAWRLKTNTETGSMDTRCYRGMELDSHLIHVVKREDGEIVKAHFIGSGVLMFHVDYLRALSKPWFRETIIPETQKRIANMDCTFVWRLQDEGGATLWIDTTIEVKHLNVFEIDDTYSERFSDWARPGVGDRVVCNFNNPMDTA